jgi:hypothetical protein
MRSYLLLAVIIGFIISGALSGWKGESCKGGPALSFLLGC